MCCIWDSLGHARHYCEFVVLMGELTREAWLRYLENGSRLFDVDFMEGVESLLV